MKKKSKGRPQHETSSPHGGLVHPAFPPQGNPQPNYMGSQSAPPMQGSPMGMPPSDEALAMQSNGGGY